MSSQLAVLEGYNVICAPPPVTKHLAVVRIKQSLLALNVVIKTGIFVFCMCRVDPNGEPNANQPTHLLLHPALNLNKLRKLFVMLA